MSYQQLQDLQAYLAGTHGYDCVAADEWIDPQNPTETYPAHCHVNWNNKSLHVIVISNEFCFQELTGEYHTGIASDNQTNWADMDTEIKNYLA